MKPKCIQAEKKATKAEEKKPVNGEKCAIYQVSCQPALKRNLSWLTK